MKDQCCGRYDYPLLCCDGLFDVNRSERMSHKVPTFESVTQMGSVLDLLCNSQVDHLLHNAIIFEATFFNGQHAQ